MAEDEYSAWLRSKHDALKITLATITPVVEDVCGNAEGIAAAQELVVGHSSVVFDVPRPDGAVIVRAKVGEAAHYEAERWARAAAADAGVPTPAILGLRHLHRDDHVVSVCVERKSPGPPLIEVFHELGSDHPRSVLLTQRMGAVLSCLHAVRPDGFGALDGQGRGPYASYAEHVSDAVSSAADRLQASPLESADHLVVQAAARSVLSSVDALNPPRPSLVHMDAGPDHCFVDGDDVVGIIDLEAVEGADPVYDLAWWDYWRSWNLPYAATRHLVEGYADKELLREDTLGDRLHLARLATGVTTLDYWVANDRKPQAREALAVLGADVRRSP